MFHKSQVLYGHLSRLFRVGSAFNCSVIKSVHPNYNLKTSLQRRFLGFCGPIPYMLHFKRAATGANYMIDVNVLLFEIDVKLDSRNPVLTDCFKLKVSLFRQITFRNCNVLLLHYCQQVVECQQNIRADLHESRDSPTRSMHYKRHFYKRQNYQLVENPEKIRDITSLIFQAQRHAMREFCPSCSSPYYFSFQSTVKAQRSLCES